MPAYPSASSGNIGALLRAIQEDNQTSPLSQPPQTQVGSPIRNLVQGPLQQVEAPQSAHVVSVRPESAGVSTTAPTQAPSAIGPIVNKVVAPVAPLPPPPPPTPVPTPTPPPSQPQRSNTPAPSNNNRIPTQGLMLATRLIPLIRGVLGASTKAPTRSSFGGTYQTSVNSKRIPIPTPTPVQLRGNSNPRARSNYISYMA